MLISLESYPKIYTLGHRAIQDLFQGVVVIEEKIDGSQFSFGVIEGRFVCRSKGATIDPNDPPGQFKRAVEHAKSLIDKLKPNVIYRGECIDKPRHNVLAYDRVPPGSFVLWDLDYGQENYARFDVKMMEADRLGYLHAPILYFGPVTGLSDIQGLLEKESILGGAKIEGVVVKNYDRFGMDKKILLGKFVSEDFKESHKKTWGDNPRAEGHGDFFTVITEQYRTVQRWQKSRQYLSDSALLTDSMRDIPALMKRVKEDVKEECHDEIKEQLFKWAWPKIERGLINGLPEWYKAKLAENVVFESNDEEAS